MADYAGYVHPALGEDRYTVPQSTNVGTRVLPNTAWGSIVLNGPLCGAGESTGEGLVREEFVDWAGCPVDRELGFHWFERVWAKPERIELGNILSTVTREIEIYNAYKRVARTFTSATNNAGPGVSFIGLPGLPTSIARQHGAIFDVQVSTEGPPTIDGTLDFVLDTGTVIIPITGTRVVMFPFEPESPLRETLEWVTDILRAADGSEQRVSVRKCPRQILDLEFALEEGAERNRFQNQLFTWHPRVFGVPIWFEARYLEADISAGATVVSIDTRWADFRVGSLAIIWQDHQTFDALEIQSKTDTSLTFSSQTANGYTARQALVMPLRVGVTEQSIAVARALNDFEQVRMRFTTIDNDVDLADTSAYGTHNSKVLLDGPNLVQGAVLREALIQETDRVDNLSGNPIQFSDWPVGQYLSSKGFVAHGAQAIWQVRQLVHALRGSQVAFYLPTFYEDINVVGDLSSGSFLMDIEHINYTEFIQAEEPNKSIWIELVDGTVLTRQVDSSVVIDSDTERLTVDVAWASTVLQAEISRVCFLRLTRIERDQVVFEHDHATQALITMNTRAVRQ